MSTAVRAITCGIAIMAPLGWSAFSLGTQNANAGDPQQVNRGPSKITQENFEKIKQGKGKLTDADVKALLGQPTRKESPFDGINSLIWEERTHITAKLKGGKAIEFNSAFLPHLKSKWITEDNFKKLKTGMAEAELQRILGTRNFAKQSAGEDIYTITWAKENTIEVQFKDGTVVGSLWTQTTEDENATDRTDADEQSRLEGTWKCIKVEIEGETVESGFATSLKQIFEKDTLKFYRNDEYTGEVSFEIDPTKNPKTMDWKYPSPERFKGKTRRGIYRLEGDSLTICFNMSVDREDRPTKFETLPASGHFLHIYKRADR